ncbi:MAG: sensor histidine kinase [Mycobacteriales bacterium]
MEPGVPFALLAGVALLAVAASLGLAGAAFGRWLRGPATVPIVIGAGLLAVTDVLTGARLGDTASGPLALARAGGLLLLAAGFALARRRASRAAAVEGPLTVAPLGAALGPTAVAVAAGALAGLAALRSRIPGCRLLAAGFAVGAAGEALAVAAQSHPGAAQWLLVLRGLGAALLLAGVTVLGRASVLSKVVQAILAAVVLTAVATAGVVGTVVADQLSQAQSRQVAQAALGELADLNSDADQAQQFASVVTQCTQPAACSTGEAAFHVGTIFTALVYRSGRAVQFGGPPLDEASLLDLAQQPAVTEALAGPGQAGAGFVLLRGAPARLVALGVASPRNPARPTALPGYAAVYGMVVDRSRLVLARQRSTFDSTLLSLPDAQVIATSLSGKAAAQLAQVTRASGVVTQLTTPGAVLTRVGEGHAPTAGYVLLQSGPDNVALLVVSAPTSTVLRTQRAVLELLFLALVIIELLVAGVALALGRRVVEPVRRLTATATAVAAGDLSARSALDSPDEVGDLSRAFDAMTSSLTQTADELRQAAEEEAATRGRLETVLNAMGDGLVVTDADGIVTGTNPAAIRLLGAVTGRSLDAVLCDPIGQPLPLSGEALLATPDGPVAVAMSASDLPDGRGRVVVVRDVSAERRVERMKTEFLANVSHELRTPLTPILAYAEMLRRRADLPGAAGEFAGQIAQSGKRLARVVDLLVDVAAFDAGRVVAAPAQVAVGPLVDERLAAWKLRAPGRAGDLRRRVSPGLPQMYVDRGWLVKAVDELVDNAVKFSPDGSPVVLGATLAPTGNQVRIYVKDHGGGVDEADRLSVFADFEQADGSATRSQEGLGLGLAFVRRAAQVTGMELSVESAPNAGSTFRLDVPVVPPPPTVPGQPRRPGIRAGRRASPRARVR